VKVVESKIFDLLEKMNSKLENLEKNQGELRQDVGGLTTEVASLKVGQDELRQDVGGLTTEVASLKVGQDELRQDVGGLTTEVASLKVGQDELRQDVLGNRDAIVKIEGVIHNKVGILFDADVRTQENIDGISSQLGRIEAKVDVLQMETANIRRVK
jgi:regulator of replication initiation timing